MVSDTWRVTYGNKWESVAYGEKWCVRERETCLLAAVAHEHKVAREHARLRLEVEAGEEGEEALASTRQLHEPPLEGVRGRELRRWRAVARELRGLGVGRQAVHQRRQILSSEHARVEADDRGVEQCRSSCTLSVTTSTRIEDIRVEGERMGASHVCGEERWGRKVGKKGGEERWGRKVGKKGVCERERPPP